MRARLVTLLLLGSVVVAEPAYADPAKVSGSTTVGVHNTYEQATYDYLARALDTGTSMIELDVWPNTITREWKVSHSDPFGNRNNCVAASTPAQLYTGTRNKNLEHCLDDIRVWLDAHPDKGPILVKLEVKPGFADNRGRGPDELDASIRGHLAGHVFRPIDLLGGHGSLDAASRADNWPDRGALRGKVLIEVIPGSVEESNPTDTLRTDVEYARYLKSLHAAGQLSLANIFPAVHGAASGDPRAKYQDATLRPWFVFFDGDASAWIGSGGTAWFDTNHYYLVMTDAHRVAPAIDQHNPTVQQASQRVADLAGQHASMVSSDWAGLSPVLTLVMPRG